MSDMVPEAASERRNFIETDDIISNITQYVDLETAGALRLASKTWNEHVRVNNLDFLETRTTKAEKILGAQRNEALVQAFDLERVLYTPEHTDALRVCVTGQNDISVDMYLVLVLWLSDVHFKIGWPESCIHLTVQIMNNFLALNTVTRDSFQRLGVCAMMVSCEQTRCEGLVMEDLLFITDFSSTEADILYTHGEIKQTLDAAAHPTASDFLPRFLQAAGFDYGSAEPPYSEPCAIAFYFLTVLSLDGKVYYIKPSLAAAAAIMCVLRVFGSHTWTRRLEYYTGYLLHDVDTIADRLVKGSRALQHEDVCTNFSPQYRVDIHAKYSSQRYAGVMEKILRFNAMHT